MPGRTAQIALPRPLLTHFYLLLCPITNRTTIMYMMLLYNLGGWATCHYHHLPMPGSGKFNPNSGRRRKDLFKQGLGLEVMETTPALLPTWVFAGVEWGDPHAYTWRGIGTFCQTCPCHHFPGLGHAVLHLCLPRPRANYMPVCQCVCLFGDYASQVRTGSANLWGGAGEWATCLPPSVTGVLYPQPAPSPWWSHYANRHRQAGAVPFPGR